MESCKKILNKAVESGNYLPRLSLFVKLEGGGTRSTGKHNVKILGDKVVKARDFITKQEIYKIELLLEEDGIKKTYSFRMKDKDNPNKPHYLVERFANIEAGTEVVLEGKKSATGGKYVDVQVVGEPQEVNEEDIPVVEEDGELQESTSTDEEGTDEL